MKKVFLFLGALVLSTGLWAADKTITLSSTDFDGFKSTYAVYNATVNGVGFTVNQGFKGTNQTGGIYPIQMNSSKGNGILYNTTAIPGLKSVTVNVASGNKKYTIYTGSEVQPTFEAGNSTTTSTINVANKGDQFFKLQVSGASYFSSIVLTYEVPTDTLYLNTGGSDYWGQGGAQFSAYYFNGTEAGTFSDFLELAAGETDIYRAIIPQSEKVIFVRHNDSAEEPTWDNKWNQTEDLTIPTDGKNLYTITGWGSGEPQKAEGNWSTYTPQEEKYYVTGDSALVGKEKAWKPDAIEMPNGEYTFEDLAAGSYLMKVTKNATKWYGYEDLSDESSENIYEGQEGNIKFILAEEGDVKVKFANNEITVTGTFAPITTTFNVNVPVGTPACYIAGTFNEWSFTKMNQVDAANYTIAIEGEQQAAEYKYLCGKDWKYVEVIDANRTYKANDTVANWTKIPGATYADTYTNNIDLPEESSTDKIYDVKVVCYGDTFPATKVGASSGSRICTLNVPAGTKNLHLHLAGWKDKTVTVTATAGETKLAELNVTADAAVSGSGSTFVLDGENFYQSIAVNSEEATTITLTGSERFVLFGVNAEGGYVKPIIDTVMYVAGNFTDWANEMVALPTQMNFLKDSTLMFKQVRVITTTIGEEVTKDTTWFGQKNEGNYMTRESNAWTLDGEHNVLLKTDIEGDYGFSIDSVGHFVVSFPEKPVQYFAKNNWEGTDWTWKEMTQDKDVYKLENVVFGGSGVDINTKKDEDGKFWIALEDFEGDKIAANDTVSLVFDPSDSTLTATLIGRPCKNEFGILVNGKYKAASVNPEQTQVTEYMVLGVALAVDDSVQMYDNCAKAAWVIENYMEGSYILLVVNNKYVVEESGTYDFYFQLGSQDQIYINQQQTTALENNSELNIQNSKFIENGQFYILRGEHIFDAQGKMVK